MTKQPVKNVQEFERLTQTLSALVGNTHKAMIIMGSEMLREHKFPIEHSQIPVIMYLYLLGDLSQQQLANDVLRDKSSIQRTVNILAKKGLVTIGADEKDRRKNIIQLTDAGTELSQKLITQLQELDKLIFNCLTKEEGKTLHALLKKIVSNSGCFSGFVIPGPISVKAH